MSITNERLRELSIDEWTWASNIEERMAIARELLAAREDKDDLGAAIEALREERDAAIARADGLAADLAACVVRAEKVEAERDAAIAQRDAISAGNGKRVIICTHCNTGLPFATIPERAEAIAQMKKHEAECEANPLVQQRDAARAEVERLRAELAERNAYRDRGVGCDPR